MGGGGVGWVVAGAGSWPASVMMGGAGGGVAAGGGGGGWGGGWCGIMAGVGHDGGDGVGGAVGDGGPDGDLVHVLAVEQLDVECLVKGGLDAFGQLDEVTS